MIEEKLTIDDKAILKEIVRSWDEFGPPVEIVNETIIDILRKITGMSEKIRVGSFVRVDGSDKIYKVGLVGTKNYVNLVDANGRYFWDEDNGGCMFKIGRLTLVSADLIIEEKTWRIRRPGEEHEDT